MKYSTAILPALAAFVAADGPAFTNLTFDVQQGQPFDLTFIGCSNGCTILLKQGAAKSLTTVQTLSSDATGGSVSITLNNIPTGSYAFEIIDNATQETNYSEMFSFQGSGSATTASNASNSMTSTASGSTMSSSMNTMSMTSTSNSMTSTSSVPSTLSTMASTTESTESSTNAPTAASTTKPPNSGAGRLASPLALVAGAIVAMILFN